MQYVSNIIVKDKKNLKNSKETLKFGSFPFFCFSYGKKRNNNINKAYYLLFLLIVKQYGGSKNLIKSRL